MDTRLRDIVELTDEIPIEETEMTDSPEPTGMRAETARGFSSIMPSIPGLTRLRWNSDADQVDVQYKQMDKSSPGGLLQGVKGWIIFLLIFVVIFAVGLIIGYVIRRSVNSPCTPPPQTLSPSHTKSYHDYSATVREAITKYISSANIKQTLKSYTRSVHISGQQNNNKLADEIKLSWINSGLDTTRIKEYRVLMSYPNPDQDKRPSVSMLDGNETVRYRTRSGDVKDPAVIPYNAWSANGTVQGDLVYANFGRLSDFEELEKQGINVTDKIVIMRYGWGFRGDKIEQAEERGASAAILYPDPEDYSLDPESVWPRGWWIDGDTVQVGTVRYDGGGDPLTPNGPSVNGAYRIPVTETRLPKIPVIPVTFNEAAQLMRNLSGELMSEDFRGGLNISYNSGPGYLDNQTDWKVKLVSNNERYVVPIKNVIGYIRGHEEPDRYVMVCNHRDAWSAGAQDPSGGTAVLTQLAQAFGQHHKNTGWQPRRTILFANWDAEEFGLIGSFEWAEEHAQELRDRLVAVINIDSPIRGNYSFSARSSPLLKDVIYQATNVTLDVTSSDNETVYQTWKRKSAAKIGYLGGGSDQTSFLHMLGIPAAYPAYTYDRKKYDVPSPPFYHTPLDTFEMVGRFVDPTFKAHESLARVMTDALLRLSDSAKLPLTVVNYKLTLEQAFGTTLTTYGMTLKKRGIKLDMLNSAVQNFSLAAEDFMTHMDKVDPSKTLLLREVNDRIMQVSRSFITPQGLPNRPQIRNVLLSPSSLNWYQGAVFPGLTDAIQLVKEDADWRIVKEQLSILIVAIQSATHILLGGVVGINIL